MKRIASIISILLILSSLCYAWTGTLGVAPGSGAAPAPACTSSDELGTTGTGSTHGGANVDRMYCRRYTAACDGTLTKAYLYSYGDYGAEAKICVYSDLGTSGTPDSSDLKLSCSSMMADAATAWVNANMDTAAATTSGTYYWVCEIAKTTPWEIQYESVAGNYYMTCSGCADTPPANLNGSWSTESKEFSMYVTLGS